jgi:hypothetical protein
MGLFRGGLENLTIPLDDLAYYRRRSATGATEAVRFDGSTGYFSRAKLTGSADGKKGIISFWFKLTGGNGADQYVLNIAQSGVTRYIAFFRDSSNLWQVLCRDTGGTDRVLMTSSGTYTADSTWHHFASSWDVATGTSANFMYIDGSSVKAGGDSAGDINLAYDTNVDTTGVGANNTFAAASFFNGDLAFLYFNEAEAIDLSNATNLQKFRTAGGAPASLGSDGSTPTGSQPILYLHGLVGAWPTNNGSGGNFTANGTITQAPTDPP